MTFPFLLDKQFQKLQESFDATTRDTGCEGNAGLTLLICATRIGRSRGEKDSSEADEYGPKTTLCGQARADFWASGFQRFPEGTEAGFLGRVGFLSNRERRRCSH